MILLLDTHVFLWIIAEPDKISAPANRALRSKDNELVFSCVSLWEMALKVEARKLDIPLSRDFIDDRLRDIGITRILNVTPKNIYTMLSIPRIHPDPFDRLLAAQCISENMRLVSADRIFRKYPIDVLW
jgi:PIN domain nuclease of toxin-antitoxin system